MESHCSIMKSILRISHFHFRGFNTQNQGQLSPKTCCYSSCVHLFVTSWTAACQVTLSSSSFQSLSKFLFIASVILSNTSTSAIHFCVQFSPASGSSKESYLLMRWSEFLSFSFSICPSSEQSGSISRGWTDLISLQSKGISRFLSNTTIQRHLFCGGQPSLWSSFHSHTSPQEKP